MVHHFWFLDVRVGGLPVRLLCRLLLAALTPAVLLPGLIRSGASKALVSTLMLLQVTLAAVVYEACWCPCTNQQQSWCGCRAYGRLPPRTAAASTLTMTVQIVRKAMCTAMVVPIPGCIGCSSTRLTIILDIRHERTCNPRPRTVTPGQAGLIFAVEERLYSGEHEDMVSAAYPAFLVLASSGLGIALTARLAQVHARETSNESVASVAVPARRLAGSASQQPTFIAARQMWTTTEGVNVLTAGKSHWNHSRVGAALHLRQQAGDAAGP